MVKKQNPSEASDTRPKVVRGRRGQLQGLLDIYLDILLEIMYHLLPLDLLHLARTDKWFRQFLLSSSSKLIWKRARENVEGLPPCPDDLSEPAYANLVFDAHCHICLNPGIKTVLWVLRLRYCPSCKKQKFLSEPAATRQYPVLEELSGTIRFDGLFPRTPIPSGIGYHVPHIEQYIQDSAQPGYQLKKWSEGPGMETRIAHANLCEEWYERLKDVRKSELQTIRDRRYADITSRLKDLGWGVELAFLEETGRDDLTRHPQVKQSKELTDRLWDKILPELLETLQPVRENCEMIQHRPVLSQRLQFFNEFYACWRHEQPRNAILPQAIDLTHHAELRSIVNAPQDVCITKASFEALKNLLPAWVDEWQQMCDAGLMGWVSRMWAGREPRYDNRARYFSLAATVWMCGICQSLPGVLHYPEVLGHSCLNTALEEASLERWRADEWEYLPRLVNGHDKWSWRRRILGVTPQERAVQVIEACGMDPEVATRAEMDALDVRLVCWQCLEAGRRLKVDAREIFTWETAILHYQKHVSNTSGLVETPFGTEYDVSLQWQRVPAHFLPRIKEIERRATVFYRFSHFIANHAFRCSYCPAGLMSKEKAKEHVDEKHMISDPKCPGFYVDVSIGPFVPFVPSPVKVIWAPSDPRELKRLYLEGDLEAHEACVWVTQGRCNFL